MVKTLCIIRGFTELTRTLEPLAIGGSVLVKLIHLVNSLSEALIG